MKANSRRRVLISSMAMLLVALVALSTATYAWFTQSTEIVASGINIKTIKSSSLEISKMNKVWETDGLDYDTTAKTYVPVSSANGTTWFKANATDKTGVADIATITDGATTYFSEQLNVRNAGEVDLINAKAQIKITNPTKIDYLRLALVPATYGPTDEKVGALGTMTDFADNIYAYVDTKYDAINAVPTTGATAIPTTEITVADNFELTTEVVEGTTNYIYTIDEIELGTDGVLEAKDGDEYTEYYYNLYVWFEGQDTDCKDANAGAVINGIEFTISGKTADQSVD